MISKKTIKPRRNLRIGVLGGIGPEASAQFYSKLIEELQKKDFINKNEDFPQIVINNIPAPELVNGIIEDKDLKPYLFGLQELDSLKVDFIVMVCNTIHLFHKELQEKISAPIIDIKKLMKNKLIFNNIKEVSILGTPSTVKEGLYSFKRFNYNNPCENELLVLGKAIENFNKGYKRALQRKFASNLASKYSKKQSAIILGCTEVPLLLAQHKFDKEVLVINSIELLVEGVLDMVKESKNQI